MSIFQYKCMTCGHEFQERAIERCPNCDSFNLSQMHAVANFQFARGRDMCIRDPINALRNRFDRQ